METPDSVLASVPLFAGLDPRERAVFAGCGWVTRVGEGEYLLREGAPADRFYLVRDGRVAIEAYDPGAPDRGARVIDTIGAGGTVGWSWLVPPYRWLYDARAVEESTVLVLDAVRLREACEADPRVGYLLLQRVAHAMYDRLHGARMRMLDVYGSRP